jgi:LPXTG-motif cell wall-anchored protein
LVSGRIAAALTTLAVVCASTSVFGVAAAAAEPPDSPTSSETAPAPPSDPPSEEAPPASGVQPAPPASQPPPSESAPPPAPRAAAPLAERAQVEVTGHFDKPSYRTSDLVTFVFRLKNVGSTRADGLRVSQSTFDPPDLVLADFRQWGDLGRAPGVSLEPGATVEVTLSGHVRSPVAETVRVAGNVFGQDGFGVGNFSFSAPLTKSTSRVAGTVFGDRNGNGRFDKGEELAGANLEWRYIFADLVVRAKTDEKGLFDFGEIPAVSYATGGTAPGFFFTFDNVVVDADKENNDLLIRAVPPLNGALHASVAFTKDSYAPGETAHIAVTLSNSGTIPLTGIVAGCDRSGEGPQLHGTGSGWGKLAFGAGGVTIAAGATQTFEVTEQVPEGFIDTGYVVISCDFGYQDAELENHPGARDIAAVPGGSATFTGVVAKPSTTPPGERVGLPGVKVVLTAPGDCPVVGQTSTDDAGKFRFSNVRPGPDYKLYFVLPAGFKFDGDNPAEVRIVANRPEPNEVFGTQAGDAPAPEIPTNPANCTAPPTTTTATPVPQASAGSGLAQTGSDMLTLGTVGLLALLLGSAFVFVGYRRRTTETNFLEP